MPWPAAPQAADYTYTMPGLGTSTLSYTLKWRNLGDALTPDANGQTPALQKMASHYLPFPTQTPTNNQGNNYPQEQSGPTLFYSDAEGESTLTYVVGRNQAQNQTFNPVVLTEIVLPNDLSYKFSYNVYGELDKVTYPTGAFEKYDLGVVAPANTAVTTPYTQASRGATARRIYPDGVETNPIVWHYATVPGQTTVTAPNGTQTLVKKYALLPPQYGTNPSNYWPFGFEDARNGQAYEESVYAPAAQGGALLRRSLTQLEQTSNSVTLPAPGTGTVPAYRNARPNKSVSLALDTGGAALASGMTYQYDTTYQLSTGIDRIQSADYDFTTLDQYTAQTAAIDAIALGALLRSSETDYHTDANYRDRNILGLATATRLKDAAGNIVAQGAVSYDEPTYTADYDNMPYGSAVTGWTNPGTSYRGNPTTASRWLNWPQSVWLSAHTAFDQIGNVRKTWDAKGTQVSEVIYT
jgi:hypothetical protein